jgi:hypothetical protein
MSIQIPRREFVVTLGGAAAVWPLAVRAQQRTAPVIGFLNTLSRERWLDYLASFHRGLREAGYVEGQNVTIDYHERMLQGGRNSGRVVAPIKSGASRRTTV